MQSAHIHSDGPIRSVEGDLADAGRSRLVDGHRSLPAQDVGYVQPHMVGRGRPEPYDGRRIERIRGVLKTGRIPWGVCRHAQRHLLWLDCCKRRRRKEFPQKNSVSIQNERRNRQMDQSAVHRLPAQLRIYRPAGSAATCDMPPFVVPMLELVICDLQALAS